MVEYRLPDLGEGMIEAELVRWLVKPGERVALDQPLAEMQTDKVLVELPAPAAGVVQALHVNEGQMVPVGTNLLTIEDAVAGTTPRDGVAAEVSSQVGQPQSDPKAAGPTHPPSGGQETTRIESKGGTAEIARQVAATGDTHPVAKTRQAPDGGNGAVGWTPAPTEPDRRVLATPSVRRLAREHGVDLKAVRGSGLAGRVLAADLRAAIEGTAAVPAPPPSLTPAGMRAAADEDASPSMLPNSGQDVAARRTRERARATADLDAGPAEERLPLRGLRRRIAENMVLSVSTMPQVTAMVEVDASGLVALRRSVLPAAEAQGVKLSYLPIIVKALVQALRLHPYVNAAIDDAAKEIVLKRHYHIGIATATPDGLLVPVLRHADRLTVLEVAAEIDRLAEGGRARTLGMEDLRGSTFTISNYGAVGGFFATPIINPGEAGILGLGRIVERPWAVDGRVEVRPVLPVSFSADHRLIDGDLAMRFMNTLTGLLEQPARLLLAMR